MKTLMLRLLVNLAAVSLIGLLLADLGFIFWVKARLDGERRVELVAAASEMALALSATGDPRPALARVAATWQVELTVMGAERVATAGAPALPEWNGDRLVAQGFEHVRVELPAGGAWRSVVASRALATTVDQVLRLQGAVAGRLVLVLLAMLAVGGVFLRRAVVQPLDRMTTLVRAEDRAGLLSFGGAAGSDLAQLSRGIIGMTQRIDEDRTRIAAQLAELRAAHDQLSSAQQQLVRAERLAVVGQLAAGLAHEVGNPLTVLGGFLSVLDDPRLAEAERRDALLQMHRELDRIVGTVRDLLDFSRAEKSAAGKGELGEALEHVRKLLAPQDRLRGVNLDTPRLTAPVEVPIDESGLTQLLVNLLLNAADAVGGKGRVRVSVATSGERVEIRVEDSGPGVPEALRARIFEPFFTTKPAGRGTGLGLAVCERLVSSAGGEITVEQSELGGAAFRITLPVAGSPRQ